MNEAAQGQSHPVSAVVAFAEGLIRGRRVAVLGNASLDLWETMFERGARIVHVYDPDTGRVAEAMARLAAREARAGAALPVVGRLGDELGVREGAFDLVLVPDVTLLGDAAFAVRTARRLVAQSGVVVLASPNPESDRFLLPPAKGTNSAPGYYELYDAISMQFPEVRMIGQAPFVGYALVDFSEDEPDVSVDTSILQEPEAPEWYVAIGSERSVDVDPYALVEIPLADVARATVDEPVTLFPPPDDRERELALTEAQARLAVLSAENEKLREEVAEARRDERDHEHAAARVAELARDVDTARGETASALAKASELEAVARRAESRAETAEADALRHAAQVEGLRADVARLRFELDAERERRGRTSPPPGDVSDELSAARVRIRELEGQVALLEPPTLRSKEEQAQRMAALTGKIDVLEARVRELEAALAAAEEERARLEADAADLAKTQELPLEPQADDVAALEARLRERGHEVTRLKRELRESERIGKELLFEIERLGGLDGGSLAGGGVPGAPSAPGGGASDEAASGAAMLADRAARTEADLVAASWRITQLERELARAGSAQTADATARERELELALVAAQREIADLRVAGSDAAPAGEVVGRALAPAAERP